MTFYEKSMNSSFVYVSVCKLFINKKLFKINDMKKKSIKVEKNQATKLHKI